MMDWCQLAGELRFTFVLAVAGVLVLVCQFVIYFITGRTSPNIRFHRLDDFVGNRVTFLIRNFDSVRYERLLVVSLQSKAAIENIAVHGMPFCKAPMRDDAHGNILITFDKVPADATFSIEVKGKPADQVKLWLVLLRYVADAALSLFPKVPAKLQESIRTTLAKLVEGTTGELHDAAVRVQRLIGARP